MENLKIYRDYPHDVDFIKIKWINPNTKTKNAGLIDFVKRGDYYYIIGYLKDKKQPPKVGYEFIKLSIDYMLKNGYKVVSIKKARGGASNRVWEKLEDEYTVIHSIIEGKEVSIIEPN